MAVLKHKKKIVRYLVGKEPALVNIPRKDGRTPLHLSVESCDPAMIVLLIGLGSKGIDDISPKSPFHSIVSCNPFRGNRNGHLVCISFLAMMGSKAFLTSYPSGKSLSYLTLVKPHKDTTYRREKVKFLFALGDRDKALHFVEVDSQLEYVESQPWEVKYTLTADFTPTLEEVKDARWKTYFRLSLIEYLLPYL